MHKTDIPRMQTDAAVGIGAGRTILQISLDAVSYTHLPQRLPCLGKAAVTVEAPYNRCQPVAEARTENNAKSKQIVYERSGTQ